MSYIKTINQEFKKGFSTNYAETIVTFDEYVLGERIGDYGTPETPVLRITTGKTGTVAIIEYIGENYTTSEIFGDFRKTLSRTVISRATEKSLMAENDKYATLDIIDGLLDEVKQFYAEKE